MNRKRWIALAAVVLVMIAAPIAWYLASPLFITRAVDESFPVAQAAAAGQTQAPIPAPAMSVQPRGTAGPDVIATEPVEMNATETSTMAAQPDETAPVSTAPATPLPTEMIAEATSTAVPAVEAEPMALIKGQFHSVAHDGVGTATLYRLPDGKQILRFENFEVLNGPDLYVWLSAAPDAKDSRTILAAEYLSLGRLKGNKGNQNYELPTGIDVSKYHSVTIWCRQFSVNFATAPLR